MIPAPKTLLALDNYTLANQEKKSRRHLGASVIGDDCARAVFYKWRWAAKSEFPARMLRLFGRGHREEPSLIAMLRGAGVNVWAAGESGELKERLRLSGFNGHFGGTPDGVATNLPDLPPEEPCLLEFKTHNDKQFQLIKKNGVFVEHRKYYIQMQVYMQHLDLKWALYLGVNKNDDEIYAQFVQFAPEVAKHYLELAGKIIYARYKSAIPPKLSQSPGFWKCNYCPFLQTCHYDAPPEINCRTCIHSCPSVVSNPPGLWTCARQQPEIDSKPEVGCNNWALNDNLFEDSVPF